LSLRATTKQSQKQIASSSLKNAPPRNDSHYDRISLFLLFMRKSVERPLNAGSIIVKNFLGLGVNLITARSAG